MGMYSMYCLFVVVWKKWILHMTVMRMQTTPKWTWYGQLYIAMHMYVCAHCSFSYFLYSVVRVTKRVQLNAGILRMKRIMPPTSPAEKLCQSMCKHTPNIHAHACACTHTHMRTHTHTHTHTHKHKHTHTFICTYIFYHLLRRTQP